MGKLQKSLKQRQRHSIRIKPHVAKLTPAEIRSLNNSAITSAAGSHPSSHASSPARSRRSTNGTPPTSPDDGLSPHRHSVSRNSPHDVLTPPHTPNGRRRSSQSSSHSHHHHQHTYHVPHSNGVIYAPRPRGHHQPSFMMSSAPSSRPSSSSSSTTYRGLPTYRGPEVTRTGSMNMLQRPSATIVANPLSQFSRPRQSASGASPERHRHSQDMGTDRSQSLPPPRANSLSNISASSSRPPSPPRVTDSPVSMMMVEETETFPALDPNDPHNQPKDFSDSSDIEHDPVRTPSTDEQQRGHPRTIPVAPMPSVPPPPENEPPASPRKEKQRRFTLSSALFGGDKSNPGDEKPGKLRKARRQTFSPAENQEAGNADSEQNETSHSALHETASDAMSNKKTDMEEKDHSQPLSVVIPDGSKGKEREIQSAPVYSRCACCGKVKKPSGFSSGLSPVLENENLRTNFSFEIERTSESSSGRRVSDASRQKFTPIIPMPISETETRQASIEPYIASPSPGKEGTMSSPKSSLDGGQLSSPVSVSSPRRPRKHLDPPKFVRFASLHGRRSVDSAIIAEEDEHQAPEDTPLLEGRGQYHHQVVEEEELFYGQDDPADLPDVVVSQPVFDIGPFQPVIQPRVLVSSVSSSQRNSEDLQLHRPSVAGSDSDAFFTPLDSISPAAENPPSLAATGPAPVAATTRLTTRTSFLDLPESNLDLQLMDFAVADTSTSMALTDAAVDSGPLDRKPGSEVTVA